jgi:hypothetical protein
MSKIINKSQKKYSNAPDINYIKDLIDENDEKIKTTENIQKLFLNVKKDDEFEFIFFSKKGKFLSQEMYIYILKYFTSIVDNKQTLSSAETLEINYNDTETDSVIRCIIQDKQNINKYMKKFSQYKNHVIIAQLLTFSQNDPENIKFMKKEKKIENTIDVDNLDFRVRLSKETLLTNNDLNIIKNLDYTKMNNIFFRYKQRTSLYIIGDINSSKYIRIDLTFTLTSPTYKNLNKSIPQYELEIEYMNDDKSNDLIMLDRIYSESLIILKIVQQSNFIISNTNKHNVIENYQNLLSVDSKNTSLDGRQTISLEIQHVTEILPNKYAVTDKADGERNFLIIMKNKVYLISSNLNVKYTGIILDKKFDNYNGTILDGEYIFLEEKNRHMFLVFDCLIVGSLDVRTEPILFERLKYADKIIDNCFVFEKQKGFESKFNPTEFNLNKYLNLYYDDILKYMTCLNNDINEHTDVPLIRRKYFIGCTGAKSWEIFAYSLLLWNAYTKDSKIKCPYTLDGIIYQPLEQPYISNARESLKADYKMKPPEKNSIDFYVEFEKDPQTGKEIIAFDNSNDEYVKNKSYKILNLYVGEKINNIEHPVLFKKEEDLYLCHIFLNNGEARDINGNLISDKTVVEFYYDSNVEVPDKFRWVPIKTRFDKTESVIRFGRKYGNYATVAEKVWRSIVNPILFEDFEDLAKGNDTTKGYFHYDKKIEDLRKRIGHQLIITANKENSYFQKTSNIAQEMRYFHNFIKSNMIFEICNPIYRDNKQTSVLDLAFGRGADIQKYYHAKVQFCVTLDWDKEAILSAVDGAISRYNQQRKKFPNYPKMYFLHGDAGSLLTLEDQNRALGGTNIENKQLIEKFFSPDASKRTMFDRIVCNFAIHYFFKNETIWENFKTNINMYLRNGGYFLVTTFDGQKVADLLGSSDKYTSSYTDEDGKKKTLFEIVKKYDDVKSDKIFGVGNAIDIYISWFSQEGRYLTEWLVDRRFMEKDLLDSCNLELVDTDNFENQLNVHEKFLNEYSKYEDSETYNYLQKVKEFYKKTEINQNCYTYNKLMRYYIFRKKEIIKQKGGNIDIIYNFTDPKQFFVPDMSSYDNDYSFLNSIHQLMRYNKIIPKHITPVEFFGDFKIDIKPDQELNSSTISNIGSKIYIEHQIKNSSSIAINGLSIFVIERDCNNNYLIEFYQSAKKLNPSDKSIILMKEGDLYIPVYQIVDNQQKDAFKIRKKGIFNMSNDLIKWMKENAE